MANKVGIEFYVAGAAAVQRDVHKIAQSVGSVGKMGLRIGGTLYAVRTVSRVMQTMFAQTVAQSPQAVASMGRLNASFTEVKTTLQRWMIPLVEDFAKGLNVVADASKKVVGGIDSIVNAPQISADAMKMAQEEYRQITGDANAFRQAEDAWGYGSAGRNMPMYPQKWAQIQGLYQQAVPPKAHPPVVTEDRAKALQEVERMNAALDQQVLVQGLLSEGREHAAEMLAYTSVLEKAYGDDMAQRVPLYKQYQEGLEAVAKIREQMAERAENERRQSQASDSVSRMNDELDRELLIIGRLNDSHERAARMVEYERQVRVAYADSLETQNRMLEEYDQKLRRLERHEQLVTLGKQVGDTWGDALEGFAVDGRKASEVARNLAQDLRRLVFRQMVTQPLANMISQGFVSMFSGGINTTAAPGGANMLSSPSVAAAVAHDGGIAGRDIFPTRMLPATVFAYAPRFHTGIGPGERAAVIRKDEGVFTPGQMRALGGGSNDVAAALGRIEGLLARQGEKRMMILDRRTGVTRDEVAGIIIDDLDHAGPVATALGRQ